MDLSSRTISLRNSSLQQSANATVKKRFSSAKKSVAKVVVQPSAQKTVLLRRTGATRPETIDFERVGEEAKKSGTLLWIDVRDPTQKELAALSKKFDFNPLSLEDALKQRQRPKVDEYPNYYFIVMYAPLESADQELHMTEIDIFVGENYVVSVHPGHLPALDLARKRREKATPELGDRVSFLAHVVVDAIIDACFPIVDDIDDRLSPTRQLDVSQQSRRERRRTIDAQTQRFRAPHVALSVARGVQFISETRKFPVRFGNASVFSGCL